MTEREAIKILISSRDYLCDGNPTWRTEPIHDAVNMAVDALRKTKNSSEKPNNCEHITEDGVTCARYPACDDCLDNPLNKVKGSERLVKGSEIPNNCEVKNYCDDCLYRDTCDSKEFFYACTSKATISKMEQVDKDINVRSKDEPQTEREGE